MSGHPLGRTNAVQVQEQTHASIMRSSHTVSGRCRKPGFPAGRSL